MWRIVFLLTLVLGLAPARGGTGAPCPQDGMCLVATGGYRVHAPAGWDGRSALPVLMHFHGYRESAGEMMAREDLRAFADLHHVLLVAPDGAGGTWSHPGSPSQNRDEFRFVEDVMADLETRYAIDHRRILVSGFSQGAAMVWNLMCYQGERFSAFLAISGTFWQPQPTRCPSGAQNLVQVHGLTDRTVPLEGRPIRNGAFRQGDVFQALGMARQAGRCAGEKTRTRRLGALICDVSGGCDSGKEILLCLHTGGHDFDPSWLEIGWGLVERKSRGE
jgi:polyhydroxybutyrate depolymerase